MEALCRITLLEPFRGNPNATVPLRDGQRSLIPMGATFINIADPAFHVGFNSEQTGEEDQNRFKAAQDVTYELGYGPEKSILISLSCAMRHFGDWTIKPGAKRDKAKRTYGQEKIRVAMNWGDYKRMPRGRKTQQGIEADTRIIGVPDVPRVRIEVLEQNGLPYGDPYEPWSFYHWEKDIDAQAVREANLIAAENGFLMPQAPAGGLDLSKLTADQFEVLAALVAEKMAGKSGKAKPAV
ncbi:MAG: hypothetical protein KGL39_32560 [Patescibacteria group bacterium]|nr:hypothetical protein [Patescibacteria group bacterium]